MRLEPIWPVDRTPFQAAVRECGRWGVEVLLVENHDSRYLVDPLHLAPQSRAGICKSSGRITWADDEDPVQAANLIHEMAHVVVWRELGFPPPLAEEPKHMLGLEYEAGRRIRAAFSTGMTAYTLGRPPREWHEWSTRERGDFIMTSIGALNASRLMRNGKPTYQHKFDIVKGNRRQR